jgi:SPP1 family predicted phage head-tail adaptor
VITGGAGRLRHRVEIQRSKEVRNEFGEVTVVWESLAEVWASVESGTGREVWRVQQVNPDITHLLRLRYLEGVSSKDRGVVRTMNDLVLNFDRVADPGGRRRELEITAKEEA